MYKEYRVDIKKAFSTDPQYYHEHSTIQKETADRLANSLDPWLYSVPPGEILEVGCGTGFFTDHLVRLFGKRPMDITDLSEEMVEFCKNRIGEPENITFKTLDVETDELPEEKYALITGNYVAEWFEQPAMTLEKLSYALKPGGLMLMAFPGEDTFPEWRKYCLDLGIPCTANSFPETEQLIIHLSMGPFQVDFYEDQTRETYDDLYAFYRHMKRNGTSVSNSGKSLSVKQVKLLNDYWTERQGGKVEVTYHNVFLALKRVA